MLKTKSVIADHQKNCMLDMAAFLKKILQIIWLAGYSFEYQKNDAALKINAH